MKVWLIDDERPCLDEMAWLLRQYPDVEIGGLDTDPIKAMHAIVAYKPDVVFLDIDMPKIDGMELALRIQEQCLGVIVVFVTAYAQYALEAYRVHPLDFLLKPVRGARLDDCMAHLRKQYELLHPEEIETRKLLIRCFGVFEVVSEREIKWGTRRVRELLQYLIYRDGAPSTKAELLDALFEGCDDKNTVHNLYMTIYRLKSLLDMIDPNHRYIRLTEDIALIFEPGVCDFSDFMRFARENMVIIAANAEAAKHMLELCRGPFLEKESFEWISESCYEIDAEYERIALGLGSFYFAAEKLQKAEESLNSLLRRNPLCEEAHTLMLDIALRSGSSEAYLERYEQYVRVMKKEFRIKPKQYYREKYEALKSL